MAILVDEIREYPHARLALKLWCHLVSDESFEELHVFAARLGIPRRGFQGDHYDLPAQWRERAVALGAREVSARELTERMAGPRGDRVRARRAARRAAAPAPAPADAAPARRAAAPAPAADAAR